MIDSLPRPHPGFTPEEKEDHARIYKAYNLERRVMHDDEQHDLSVKMRMKIEALKHIGGQWGVEAKKVEVGNYPPLWRKMMTVTPPIEGFDVRKYESMNPNLKN